MRDILRWMLRWLAAGEAAEPPETPASRIYVVPVEDRTFAVKTEDRVFVVR